MVLGQVDTFDSNSTDNWSGNAPNVGSGGPGGASDPFLLVGAVGGGGPGSKLVTYNRDQWLGDYLTAGVTQITVDLKDFSTMPLTIRLAFKDGVGFSAGYSSTNAYVLAADSAWHHATFSITAADMTALSSPAESFNSLIGPGGALAEVRILDASSPSLFGDVINANLGIDNITATSAGPSIASATWNAASGNWEDGSKWVGGTPAYGAGQTATFPDPAGTAPASATVTLTAGKIIGALNFTATSQGAYTLTATGGSTLTFNSSTGSTIHLAATAGNVTLSVPVVFNSPLVATTDGTTILAFAGGITGSGGLTKAGTGTLAIAAPGNGTGVSPLTLSALAITGGNFVLQSATSRADRTLLATGSLSISAGQLDLGGNDAIFQAATLSSVQTLLLAGYNAGRWNGSGPAITSSLAASTTAHLTAIGAITGVNAFDGRSVSTSDVVAKYTYYGDANLDGKVDGSDYSRIDSGFLTPSLTGWQNGDFNYDGHVNGADYTLIDNVFNMQGAALTSEIASPNAAIAAVPEPAAGLLLIAVGSVGLLHRRRRVGQPTNG